MTDRAIAVADGPFRRIRPVRRDHASGRARRRFLAAILLAASGVFGALPEGNWRPEVRHELDRLIDRHAGDPTAYAVFDFDLTCALSDLEHVALDWYLDNLCFGFSPEEMAAVFLPDVPDPDEPLEPGRPSLTVRNLLADCSDLYAELVIRSKTESPVKLRATALFAAFSSKFRYLRECVDDFWGAAFGYPWIKRFYARKTPAQFQEDLSEALDRATARGVFERRVWATPSSLPGRTGCVTVAMTRGFFVPQEMKDLHRALHEAGIPTYIVSGSYHAAVLVGASARYGLAVPPDRVFGMRIRTDDRGLITGEADTSLPLTWGEGKPEIIRNRIAPRHQGKDPILVVGDSNGDYGMLTAFPGLERGLIFDTCPKGDSPLGRLLTRIRAGKEPRYLLQGRDENVPAFRPSDTSVLAR